MENSPLELSKTQHCEQEKSLSLDPVDPEPTQIKEEQQELCIIQEKSFIGLEEDEDAKGSVLSSCVESEDDHVQSTSNRNIFGDSVHTLEEQMQTHVDEKILRCRVHGDHVGKSRNVKDRRTFPTEENPYKCTECEKAFNNPGLLQPHMGIHEKKTLHSCTICNKRFNSKSLLEIHLRAHSGERPYTCTDCGKGFTQITNLKTHMVIHTDPFGIADVASLAGSTSHSSCEGPIDPNWHFNFQIPWNRMPSVIKRKLESKERPSASERREVVRLMVAEMLAVCKKPRKKHVSEIARQVVLAYPESFTDNIGGDVVGSGFDSITKQLQCRIDNVLRADRPSSARRKTPDRTEKRNRKRRRKEGYGCINEEPGPLSWSPQNSEKQQRNKEEMIKMSQTDDGDLNEIACLMTATFPSQRKDVMAGRHTEELKEDWPFLFHITGIKAHFKELTGVHIDNAFQEAMDSKLRRTLDYFLLLTAENPSKGAGGGRLRAVVQAAGGNPCCAVLMILAHFRENEDAMFVKGDEASLATDIWANDLPSTPCIVVCGDSAITAKTFMVAVDQVVVNDRLTFKEALQMMFILYYVLNIDYPAEIAATMEFLQRCLFRINPDQGTKVQRGVKKKSYIVNPKVLTLISHISEFEKGE